MKFKIKALDDAVSESSQIFSTIIGWLNKLSQLAQQFKDYEVNYTEYSVNLSNESPYAKLTPEQRMYKAEVNKVHDAILPYMHYENELKEYEKDYQDLLAAIEKFKEHAKKRLLNMVSAIKNMPEKRKIEKDKREHQGQIINVKQEYKSFKRDNPEAETVNTTKKNILEYLDKIAKMIDLSDEDRQKIAQSFGGYQSLDDLAVGIENVVNLIK